MASWWNNQLAKNGSESNKLEDTIIEVGGSSNIYSIFSQ